MTAIIDFITKKAFNETIAFLFLILGLIIGLFLTWIILKAFSIKQQRPTSFKPIEDIGQIEKNAVEIFNGELTKFESKKLTLLSSSICLLLESIPSLYQSDVSYYTVVKKEDFDLVEKDVKVCLDFTVYEAVYFMRSLVCSIDGWENGILEKGIVKFAYGVGRNAISPFGEKRLSKNAGDCNLKDLIFILNAKIKKTEKENVKKPDSIVKKFVNKVKNKAKNIVVDKANSVVDEHIAQLLGIIATELNLLYSDSFKFGVASLDSMALIEFGGEKR